MYNINIYASVVLMSNASDEPDLREADLGSSQVWYQSYSYILRIWRNPRNITSEYDTKFKIGTLVEPIPYVRVHTQGG